MLQRIKNWFKKTDGIYVVKSGKVVKVDSYLYGYEGLATFDYSAVEEIDGKKVLSAGPHDSNSSKIIKGDRVK